MAKMKKVSVPHLPKKINTETGVPHDGFVIGGAKKSGNPNMTAAMDHDGIVIGGSVKKARTSVAKSAIDKLSNTRQDGKVL